MAHFHTHLVNLLCVLVICLMPVNLQDPTPGPGWPPATPYPPFSHGLVLTVFTPEAPQALGPAARHSESLTALRGSWESNVGLDTAVVKEGFSGTGYGKI